MATLYGTETRRDKKNAAQIKNIYFSGCSMINSASAHAHFRKSQAGIFRGGVGFLRKDCPTDFN